MMRANRRGSGNDENRFDYVLVGFVRCALLVVLLVLGGCLLIVQGPFLFPGDTILAGALIIALLCFILGEDFIDWLKENWWRF
jgi:hypothetical protein